MSWRIYLCDKKKVEYLPSKYWRLLQCFLNIFSNIYLFSNYQFWIQAKKKSFEFVQIFCEDIFAQLFFFFGKKFAQLSNCILLQHFPSTCSFYRALILRTNDDPFWVFAISYDAVRHIENYTRNIYQAKPWMCHDDAAFFNLHLIQLR